MLSNTILKKELIFEIEGQLSTRKWKDESFRQDKYSTEVVLQGYNSVLLCLTAVISVSIQIILI